MTRRWLALFPFVAVAQEKLEFVGNIPRLLFRDNRDNTFILKSNPLKNQCPKCGTIAEPMIRQQWPKVVP